MNWRLKIANWLSGGVLEKCRRQEEIAQAKLKQQEIRVENLSKQLEQYQTDIERLQAQLQISKGFQVELGETQIQLQSIKAQAERERQQLKSALERLNAMESQQQQIEAELSISKDWFKQVQQQIKVTEVKKLLPKQEFDTLWGFGLGSPKADTMLEGAAVVIKGWVLGRKSAVTKVQITFQNRVIIEANTGLSRPTVTQQYPDIPNAGNSGFECSFSVVGMPSEAELAIEAVLEEDRLVPLCAIVLQK